MMIRMIFRDLANVKIIATVGGLTLAGLHEYLRPFLSYTILYVLSIMYGEEIPAKYGVLILVFLGIYLLLWIISPILLRIRSRTVSSIGIIGIIVLNVCDMVCCVFSFLELQVTFKVINFVFSALVIVLAVLSLKQGHKTEDGSLVSTQDRGRFA